MPPPSEADRQRLRMMQQQVEYISKVQGHAEHVVRAILRTRCKATGRTLSEEVEIEYGRTMTALATM